MKQMKDILSRIDGIIQEKQNGISSAQAAVDENQKLINESNAAAAAALAAGDENAYVAAKQKAAEWAARLEYNQQRIFKLKERKPRPDGVEIRRAAMDASVAEYKVIAKRILELIDELLSKSEQAEAIVSQYNKAKNKYHDYIDADEYWPDFPNLYATKLDYNLSIPRKGIADFLSEK